MTLTAEGRHRELGLTDSEYERICELLEREPNEVERGADGGRGDLLRGSLWAQLPRQRDVRRVGAQRGDGAGGGGRGRQPGRADGRLDWARRDRRRLGARLGGAGGGTGEAAERADRRPVR